jgi:adenylate kinase family enzyme
MCSRYGPFKSTKVSKKSLLPASGNREYETEIVSPNVNTHLMSSESPQKTVILVGPPRKTSYHERMKRFLTQVKEYDSTADITTCFATITKCLKNYNKHFKCLRVAQSV